MGCFTDPQCLLFVGSALLAAVAIAVSDYLRSDLGDKFRNDLIANTEF